MASATRWALTIAFFGGLVPTDGISVVSAALGAFILGTACAPWRAGLLALASWAAATGVVTLLNLVVVVPGFEAPSGHGPGLTVLAAYSSALAGTALAWVSARLMREGPSSVPFPR